MDKKLEYFTEENGFQEHKKEAIKLLERTVCFLNEFNIGYCLISGTLLGCVRHNDFIPWDDDIDLIVEDTIYEKLQMISSEFDDVNIFLKDRYDTIKACFSDGKEIVDPNNWKEYSLGKNKRYCWPFVDMFTYSLKEESIFFFIKDWDIKEFTPFQKVNFLGIDVFIPKNPDYFLKCCYGDNYMTEIISPSYSHKDERIIHHRETSSLVEIENEKISFSFSKM
jgi:phosphorylcholine metabolism protein LicD